MILKQKTNTFKCDPNGLVLHLDAASYTSGLTWSDLSGNGNDALLDATYPPVHNGDNSFNFTEANNNSAVITNDASLNFGTGDFTILHYSTWTKKQGRGNCILHKGARFDDSLAGYLLTAGANGDNNAGLFTVVSDGSTRNEMQLFINSYGRSFNGLMRKNGYLYNIINGVAINYGYNTFNINSTADITIAYNPIYQVYWSGNIEAIIMYNRSLSDNELTTLFKQKHNQTILAQPVKSLANGLVSYYKLDGNSNDSVGVVAGVNNNITYSNGKINQGANFNPALSSQILLNSDLSKFSFVQNTLNFSISFWYNSTTYHFGMVLGNIDSGQKGYFLGVNSANLYLGIGNGKPGYSVIEQTTCIVYDGKWHNVIITGDGTNLYAYHDGVKVETYTIIDTLASGDSTFATTMGQATYLNPSFGFNGKLDEVGIWNRGLTDSEASKLYNAGKGLTHPFLNSVTNQTVPLIKVIKAAYNFDNNVNDVSGNGYNLIDYGGIYSVTFGTGVVGQCGEYGSPRLSPIAKDLDMSNVGTIAFWMKPNSAVSISTNRPLMGSDSSSAAIAYSNNPGFRPNTLIFNSGLGSIYVPDIFPDIWTHVAFSYDANGTNVYVNGRLTLFQSGAIGSLIFKYIGYSGSSGERFEGSLDAINFFDRPLKGEDIHLLYKTKKQYPF